MRVRWLWRRRPGGLAIHKSEVGREFRIRRVLLGGYRLVLYIVLIGHELV